MFLLLVFLVLRLAAGMPAGDKGVKKSLDKMNRVSKQFEDFLKKQEKKEKKEKIQSRVSVYTPAVSVDFVQDVPFS